MPENNAGRGGGRGWKRHYKDPICFTKGTRIATIAGERKVECLKPGDRVITRDNGIQEIAWIGSKTLDQHHFAQNSTFRPILIKAGALGNDLPAQDLLVSPNHRMLIANDVTTLLFEERETLVAAKFLVGRPGVEQINTERVTYFHLLFERHEIILGDRAWSESFQPGDYSIDTLTRDQRDEIFALFPELESRSALLNFSAARRSLTRWEARLLK